MSGLTILSLSVLTTDDAIQPRTDGLNQHHVDALTESGPGAWPPVVVVTRGSDHVLVDGYHRLAAARSLGVSKLACEIRPEPDDGDLRGLAFMLNSAHGLPLTLTERKVEAERLLAGGRHDVSSNELAKRCGLSDKTVEAIRAKLESTSEIPKLSERIGGDGKKRPATKGGARERARRDDPSLATAPQNEATATVDQPTRPTDELATLMYHVRALTTFADDRAWTASSLADAITDVLEPADAANLALVGGALTTAARSLQNRAPRDREAGAA